ncbi:MAG: CvpA family protein [Candidatus Dormibacteraeota bacterium]|nr:CvpA family protein [Candidatus Dormibacteraeota bacterium]MBO0703995.1 CvpA family protein [Candidatus Dormibacteraeota bacterium]MBO0762299.1 CvpA family protein [Candidatus Dormibacteraeota bacterium]
MILDLVILILVAVAVFIGFQRGLIQPLFAYLGVGIVALVAVTHWADYSGFLDRTLHIQPVIVGVVAAALAVLAGYLGARVGGLIHRMPAVRGADGLFGVFLNAFVAILVCYSLLSVLVALGKAFATTASLDSLTAKQVAPMEQQIKSNPALDSIVSQDDLTNLQQQSAAGAVTLTDYPTVRQLQTVYVEFAGPQLTSSKLAPIVLFLGDHTPLVGHYGPQDLPTPPKR